MIDLEKLKPIIADLLTDENSADIISKITEIDEKPADNTATEEAIKKATDEVEAKWNQKFRETFLKGSQEVTTEKQKDAPEGKKEDEEDYSYASLFLPLTTKKEV